MGLQGFELLFLLELHLGLGLQAVDVELLVFLDEGVGLSEELVRSRISCEIILKDSGFSHPEDDKDEELEEVSREVLTRIGNGMIIITGELLLLLIIIVTICCQVFPHLKEHLTLCAFLECLLLCAATQPHHQ